MERNDFLGIKMIINRNKVCEIAYALRFQKISKSDISFYIATPHASRVKKNSINNNIINIYIIL